MENTKKEEVKACDCCPEGCTCGDCACCKKDSSCGTWCCDTSKACCSSGWSTYRRWAKWLLWFLAVLALVKFLVWGTHGGMRWGMKWGCGCGWDMISWSVVSGQMNCMWAKGMKWERKWWFNRGKWGDRDDNVATGTVVSGNVQ